MAVGARRGPRRPTAPLVAALCLSWLAALCVVVAVHPSGASAVTREAATVGRTARAGRVVVWAVGDLCEPRRSSTDCADVARLIARDRARSAVLILGDAQYDRGRYADYRTWYHPKMGRHRSISHPVPGNHDYKTPRAAGYFRYWRAKAGSPDRGYYARRLGAWRVVALNTNCREVRCGRRSPQARFLARQLARPERCELVFGHHPRFADGRDPVAPGVTALFRRAYAGRAELYLAGHHHSYQRFRRLDPLGQVDKRRGVRTFVVGTGGGTLVAPGAPRRSRYRQSSTLGALRLVLRGSRYTATFVTVRGVALDRSRGTCRG